MYRFIYISLLICLVALLTACQYENISEKTWIHDEKGLFTGTFSKDGSLAIVAAIGGPASLIDTETNETLHHWQHTDENHGVIAAAISANNKFAITAEKNTLALWQVSSGKIIGYWDFPVITDIKLSANGKYALIGMENNKAYYFDLYYGKIIHTFEHDGIVNTVALSDNGQYAITGGNAHQAKLWDISTGDLVHQWKHIFKVYNVALSDDAQYAMSNDSLGKTRMWNTQSGKFISQLPMRYMTVSASAFSPDSKYLLTGRPNQRIDLWDVKTGKLLNTWTPKKRYFWRPDTAAIIALAFSESGQHFFSEASSGIAQKWKISK